MKKYRHLKNANRLLLILVVASCAWLIWQRQDLLEELSKLSVWGLLFVLIAKFATSVVNAAKFRVLINFFKLQLTFKEWFGLTAVTTLYGRILPGRVGFIPRAWYLKKHHQFKYSSYVSLLGGSNIIDILVNAFIGLLALSLLGNSKSPYHDHVHFGFLLSLLFAIAGMGFMAVCRFLKIKTRWEKLNKLITTIFSGFAVFHQQPTLLIYLILVTTTSVLVQAYALGVCFNAMEYSPPFFLLAATLAAVNLSSVLSITPGNIGISEGVIVGVMSLYNIPLDLSISASILSRGASLIVQIGLGIVYSYIIFGKVFDSQSIQTLQKEIN